MARPLTVERHPARVEIDFLIGIGVGFSEIGAHYDIDPRAIASYRRAMVAARPGFFDRFAEHRLAPFVLARRYADLQRASLRRAAETAFKPSAIGSNP